MTEKSNMGADDRGYEEVYDSSKNEDDWSFSDLDGNPQVANDIDETYPTHQIKAGMKTIEVYHQKYGTLWGCKFKEGGELPRSLKGKFTSAEDAVNAAKLYVAQLETE
jgi:hypothetical protein